MPKDILWLTSIDSLHDFIVKDTLPIHVGKMAGEQENKWFTEQLPLYIRTLTGRCRDNVYGSVLIYEIAFQVIGDYATSQFHQGIHEQHRP